LRAFQLCVALYLHTLALGRFSTFSGRESNCQFPAFLSHITCVADVWMAHVRPSSTSPLQDLFNGIKNTSRRGVLTPGIEFWIFESPGGLPNPHFGNVSVILTLLQSGVATNAPMCIFVGECPTMGDFQPIVLVNWQQIKAWIRKPMQVDVILVDSRAHWFQWI
jgi:hypothetical protein